MKQYYKFNKENTRVVINNALTPNIEVFSGELDNHYVHEFYPKVYNKNPLFVWISNKILKTNYVEVNYYPAEEISAGYEYVWLKSCTSGKIYKVYLENNRFAKHKIMEDDVLCINNFSVPFANFVVVDFN